MPTILPRAAPRLCRALGAAFFLALALTAPLPAETPGAPVKTIIATSISLLGTPKYPPGFTHFDYVNPAAPKGGTLVRASLGTYDNFHRYALRGNCAAGSEYLYDTLMTGSDDEYTALYPLIAQSIEYAEDYSFVILTIDPRARDQEGQPITAEDAAFSFTIIFEKGVPQFRSYYEGVTVEVLPGNRVRFTLPEPGDREKMISLCSSTVFPKRFWVGGNGHDFSEPLTTPPVGTGPYRVGDYKIGQYVVLERVKDYWAADLPVRRGHYNFDRIRFDYYRDDTVSIEAFNAGEYDFRQEGSALSWATKYTGTLYDTGVLVKETVPHEIPQPMQGVIFNIQRPVFQNRRVRKALTYFLDFEWMNKNLFYNQYQRCRSYFQNTPYAATGRPTAEELAVLEPIRDKVPPEVFGDAYQPPVTDGTGSIRPHIRQALALLKQAGWELTAGKLVNAAGEQFRFELLIYDSSQERTAIPLQRNFQRYGIDMRIRLVDTSQYINRLRSRDFDALSRSFPANPYPSADMAIMWHSQYIDSTWNTPGVMDPAVDYLIEGIMAHQGDEAALLTWGHALDRVLTWNCYCIPQWYSSEFRLAYRNVFGKPAVRPRYSIGLDTWWRRP